MKRILILPVIFLCSNAAMCAHDEPGVRVETVEVVREVQKPCPGPRPGRPDPIENLPVDLGELVVALGAKLAEYAGRGGYADQSEAVFDRCLTDTLPARERALGPEG